MGRALAAAALGHRVAGIVEPVALVERSGLDAALAVVLDAILVEVVAHDLGADEHDVGRAIEHPVGDVLRLLVLAAAERERAEHRGQRDQSGPDTH